MMLPVVCTVPWGIQISVFSAEQSWAVLFNSWAIDSKLPKGRGMHELLKNQLIWCYFRCFVIEMIPKQQLLLVTPAIPYPCPQESRMGACRTGNFQDEQQTCTTHCSVSSSPFCIPVCNSAKQVWAVTTGSETVSHSPHPAKNAESRQKVIKKWVQGLLSLEGYIPQGHQIMVKEGHPSISLFTLIHGKIYPLLVQPEVAKYLRCSLD